MSKIICDVCGTSYPETATQCPICGCVRSGDPITVAGDTNEADIQQTTSYTRVRGGRFSKSNVKKRNAGKPIYNSEPVVAKGEKKTAAKKAEKGLVVTVIILLLAIAAVVIYIALSIFEVKLPLVDGQTGETSAVAQTQQSPPTTIPTTEATMLKIPCESLEISDSIIEFDKAGAALLLNVKAMPKDHTDSILFQSKDDRIATVDSNGKITAVSNGETIITVECGSKKVECRVICSIPGETTAATIPEMTYSQADFKLNSEDFSIPTSEKSYRLYTGDIPLELIEFKSEDESIATFVDGVVTVVKAGTTTVSATFQGVTLECIVRVW